MLISLTACSAPDADELLSFRGTPSLPEPVSLQANEIVLSFPAAGGAVEGSFIQAGVWPVGNGCDFTQQLDGVLTGTMTLAPDSSMGSLQGNGTIQVNSDTIVTDQCPASPQQYAYEFTWMADYDPATGMITNGQIFHSDGAPIYNFDARPAD